MTQSVLHAWKMHSRLPSSVRIELVLLTQLFRISIVDINAAWLYAAEEPRVQAAVD